MRALARRNLVAASVMPVILLLVLSGFGFAGNGSDSGHTTSGQPKASLSAELDGLHFTNVTGAAGLASPQSDQTMSQNNSMTGGVAACDFFGNGLIDFYVTRVGLPNELFRNNGNGTFTDVAKAAGVQGTDWQQGYAGATCGDLNGDGRPDLYVTSAGDTGNILYMNNGNSTFTNDTAAAGLTLPPVTGSNPSLMYGSAFGDYNHDGRLDIITVQWYASSLASGGLYGGSRSAMSGGACALAKARQSSGGAHIDLSRSRLYQNDGNGRSGIPRFTDMTKSMGLDFSQTLGFTPTFVDLTGNGWDDLVISGDGCTSQIYMNEDGKRFVNVTQKSGADTAENGMGSVFADFTGNGLPDWFETSIFYPGKCPTAGTPVGCSGNRLYLNNGNGTFRDGTDQYGVRDGGWGWGAAAEDFNNSGRLSIAQVDGMLWSPDEVIASRANPKYRYYRSFVNGTPRLWLNDGTTPFPQVAQNVGLTTKGLEKAVVPVDYLNDGKLGLFITNTSQGPVLYRNDTTNDNGWVDIRLHDPLTENTFGVGASVRVRTTAKGPVQEAELLDGGSYESSNPLELHFGFGPHVSKVSEIEVFWPGQAHPQVLRHVAVDRVLVITRNS